MLSFFVVDGRIWVRHYQLVYDGNTNTAPPSDESIPSIPGTPPGVTLVEIGPRMVLCPIRVFSGSFGGGTLWENADYVSPNALRAEMKASRGREYVNRQIDTDRTRAHKKAARLPDSEIDGLWDAAKDTESAEVEDKRRG